MQSRLCEPTNGITASADGGRRLDGSHCGSDIWSHFLHSNIETAALFAEAMNASKDDIPSTCASTSYRLQRLCPLALQLNGFRILPLGHDASAHNPESQLVRAPLCFSGSFAASALKRAVSTLQRRCCKRPIPGFNFSSESSAIAVL